MDRRRDSAVDLTYSRLDGLIHESRAPGIQYLVVGREGIRFEYHGGWADLGDRRPMTPTTTMMAYSMSKTVTAAAVLTLVQAGRMALNDPLDRLVEWHPYGPDVTLRRMLSHTSGIPNPIPLRWVHPAADDSFDEGAALAAVLQKHPRLSFAPGTRYGYSNIGYWLLGSVVERVSGEDFASYVAGHILSPLGIESVELGYVIGDPEQHASGYLERASWMNLVKGALIDRELIGPDWGRWVEILGHCLDGHAFGGLVGTARGFGKFLQDQLEPHSRVLDDPARSLFFAPQRIDRDGPIPMTLGWHMGAMGDRAFFYKEGGGGGFHCMMRLYPADGIATVMMTNATLFDVRGHLNALDVTFLRRE